MKLSERMRKERFMGGCGERAGEWADEVEQLETENEGLKEKKVTCPHCARFIMLTDEGRRMMAERDALQAKEK